MPSLKVLGEVLGNDELSAMDDHVDGFARRDEITAIVRAAMTRRNTKDWLTVLHDNGIWAGPVYTYADVLSDPQVRHNGSFVSYDHPTEGPVTTPGFPYQLSASPPSVERGAPLVGEHTGAVLAELGYGSTSIDDLFERGIVAGMRP